MAMRYESRELDDDTDEEFNKKNKEAQDIIVGIVRCDMETETPYEMLQGIAEGSEEFERH